MSARNRPEVVVTGAGACLGRAIAQAFAKRRAHVGLLSRDRERLEDARCEVEAAGGQAVVLPAEVADTECRLRGRWDVALDAPLAGGKGGERRREADA